MRVISKPPSERQPQRMQALSVLPVFFSLQGKSVLIVSGSDAAAWKAELLLATGAIVHVVSPVSAICEQMEQLLRQDVAQGRLVHIDAELRDEHFAGMAIAVADIETEEEAAAFQTVAKRAGVPVNVIDKPAFCDFQFGSIVNRSPVVVGISTDGAAPILGQAIRRKIETLLPAALAAWAGLAQRLRSEINARLDPGPKRRIIWERLVDKAFGPTPRPDEIARIADDIEGLAQAAPQTQGSVTLVGAGPGDAELLTLKAMRALQAADVILFDDLVSDGVLELARREAKRILVGKRGGRPSCRQDEINDMMVTFAKAGRRVVRLKSGDPLVFGRAGEEIERLHEEGIPVEVVPGITAGSAMAAALGVSLTHRDCAKSVRYVTGHSRQGGLPEDLDWAAIADPSATTIFYMGGRTASAIADRLMQNGMSAETPVVIASAVSRPEQRVWRCALGGLARSMAEAGNDEPIIIGVGKVFSATRQQGQAAVAA